MSTTHTPPPSGKQDAKVMFRLQSDLLAALDRQAEEWGLSRNMTLIRLLQKALAVESVGSSRSADFVVCSVGESAPIQGILVVTDLAAAANLLEVLRQEREAS